MGIQLPHTSHALKDKKPRLSLSSSRSSDTNPSFRGSPAQAGARRLPKEGLSARSKASGPAGRRFDNWQGMATSQGQLQGSVLQHPKLLEQQEGKNKRKLRTAASYLCLEGKRAGSMRDQRFATIPTRREAIYTSTAWQFPPSRFSGSWAASTAPSTAPARARQLPAMPGTSADRPAHVDPSWKLGDVTRPPEEMGQ